MSLSGMRCPNPTLCHWETDGSQLRTSCEEAATRRDSQPRARACPEIWAGPLSALSWRNRRPMHLAVSGVVTAGCIAVACRAAPTSTCPPQERLADGSKAQPDSGSCCRRADADRRRGEKAPDRERTFHPHRERFGLVPASTNRARGREAGDAGTGRAEAAGDEGRAEAYTMHCRSSKHRPAPGQSPAGRPPKAERDLRRRSEASCTECQVCLG